MQPKDMVSLVQAIREHNLSLHLNHERLAFLTFMALLHNEAYRASFQEEELVELFYTLEPLLPSGGEPSPSRASHLMNELVSQRLLLRLFGDSMEPQATYRLTPLGLAIAEHILNRQEYSALSLSVQLQQLSQNLHSILEAANRGGDLQHWRQHVFGPLKYAVAELFDRIDQNQRHLDAQQKSTQEKIAELIHQRWSESLQACEALLNETSEALQDLQRALEVVGAQLQAHLTALKQKSLPEEALHFLTPLMAHLQSKLDRILGWGERTMGLWASYDRHVHKFLRTILAIEHSKRLAYLLQQSVFQFIDQPWMMSFCQAERYVEYDPKALATLSTPIVGALSELPMVLEGYGSEASELNALRAWLEAWEQENPGISGLFKKLLQDYFGAFPFSTGSWQPTVQRLIDFFASKNPQPPHIQEPLSIWGPIEKTDLEVQADASWVVGPNLPRSEHG